MKNRSCKTFELYSVHPQARVTKIRYNFIKRIIKEESKNEIKQSWDKRRLEIAAPHTHERSWCSLIRGINECDQRVTLLSSKTHTRTKVEPPIKHQLKSILRFHLYIYKHIHINVYKSIHTHKHEYIHTYKSTHIDTQKWICEPIHIHEQIIMWNKFTKNFKLQKDINYIYIKKRKRNLIHIYQHTVYIKIYLHIHKYKYIRTQLQL